jgi:hypothetical protein
MSHFGVRSKYDLNQLYGVADRNPTLKKDEGEAQHESYLEGLRLAINCVREWTSSFL